MANTRHPFAEPTNRSVIALSSALLVLGVALASCADEVAVLRHSASVSERNALIVEVRVTLDRAARVFVEYDHPQAGRYRTALSEPGAEHAIPIVRLRPETTYDYTIFVVDGSVADGAAVAGADADAGPGGRFTTGPLPLRLAAIPMRVHGRSSQPLILSDSQRGYYLFWDEVGEIVWYYDAPGTEPSGIVQLPAGNFLFVSRGRIAEFTPLGELVTRIEPGGAAGTPHHEVTVLADGRVIYPSFEQVVIDDSANGGPEEATFGIDTLRVWDRASGRFAQVWDSTDAWDLLDPAQRGGPHGRESGYFNWTHLNSVSIGPRGNVVLSFRARNQVVSLSADLREIEWQLNGPDSDYEFPDPNDRFYAQHTAAQLDNGNVLLFDNGLGRPDAEGGAYSRALELRLDAAAGTAVKVWEYRPTPDIYSSALSSAYRLSNGNTLINFSRGDREGNRSVVEVDAAGNEVFRIDNPPLHADGHLPVRYRAYDGIGAIMGETMLRPPAAAPAHVRGATFEEDYYLAKERARFRELEESLDGLQRAAGGAFDVYQAGSRLVYAKEPCRPQDVRARFFLHVFPAAEDDLAAVNNREQGSDNSGFNFWTRGVLLEGTCLVAATLPEYEIARIRTGQYVPGGGGQLWSVEFATGPTAQRYREARAAIRSGAWGAPAARAAFDIYFDGRMLAYHKEPCAEEDLRERFFLHVIPADAEDLAPQARPHGFENRDFDYREHGALLGAACVALVPLPEYELAGLRTGQFISGQGQLWSAEIQQ